MQEVFEDLAAGRSRAGCRRARDAERVVGSQAAALASVAAFWSGDFAEATTDASRARSTATDGEDQALAAAASGLASAGEVPPHGVDPIAIATDILLDRFADDPWWSGVRYLTVEASLMCAQMTTAARVPTFASAPAKGWEDHPFATVMTVCAVRLAAFRGHLTDAAALLAAARQSAGGGRMKDLAEALDYMVLNQSAAVPALTSDDEVTPASPAPVHDLLERGIVFLTAYGAQAAGDHAGAAHAIFRAGGDSSLSRCTLIDRALGLELLLVAALNGDDQPAADAWVQELLDLNGGRICEPSVNRALARYALAAGDTTVAKELCVRSIDDCNDQGRALEAAEGELLLADISIAGSDVAAASRRLRSLVERTDRQGHGAVRRIAGATLATVNRRLPPRAGLGWAALSTRETEAALLILEGLSVPEIATHMSLSVGTVRIYVSRVLCAFNVSTRVGLLASVGVSSFEGGQASGTITTLSPRQKEVAALIAQDLSNVQISAALDVTPRTVEKHISDILQRLDGTSRFDIARWWWADLNRERPA